MKLRNLAIPFILLSIIQLMQTAHPISADFMEGQFESVMYIPQVNSIEAWEQPRTKYTPSNLKSEYQIRYNGSDTNGRNAYSYTTHFTDYDTYITGNGITADGKYYVQQNNGKAYITGEKTDLTPVYNGISSVQNNINNISDRVDNLSNRLDTMGSKMKQGFATVTALTSLHPNPRSNEKLEVAVGTGMYQDTVAGAIGLFYHPNNRVQLYAGAAYGGHESWAGGAGVTFSIGGKRK